MVAFDSASCFEIVDENETMYDFLDENDTLVLGKSYLLQCLKTNQVIEFTNLLTKEEFKQLQQDFRAEIQQWKRQRTDHESITISSTAYYFSLIKGVNIRNGWIGIGTSFLQANEVVTLQENEKEDILVARMYPVLKRKLLPYFPSGYELMNGEKYGSIPPNLHDPPKNLSSWFAPDLLMLPNYLIEFHLPQYANAPASFQDIPITYGRLSFMLCYRYCVILDAKVQINESVLGDFFHYFQKPTMWLECQMRGMLFSPDEFVLVKWIKGVLVDMVRGRFTSPGTEELINSFLSECDKSLDTCLRDALVRLEPMTEPLTVASYRSNETDKGKSATLGCGAFGIVIQLIGRTSQAATAIKIVLGDGHKYMLTEREYLHIYQLQETSAKDFIVGVIKDSFLSVKQPDFLFDYQAYLMPVGIPFSPLCAPSKEEQKAILRSLFQLHRMGNCHGDPRYVNCVNYNGKFCWIDFLNVFCWGLGGVEDDLIKYLSSIKVDRPSESLIRRYIDLVQRGGAMDSFDSLHLSELINTLIPENP